MLDRRTDWTSSRSSASYRRMRLVSGPQGPRVVLDGKPVLLLCSNNYLGLADHPRVREAAADAAMRWGVGAGASRLVSGHDDAPPPAGGAARDVRGHAGGAAVRLRLPGQHRRRAGAGAAAARSSSPTSSTTPRSSTAAGSPRAETFVYRHGDVEHLAWGLRQADGRGALIVTDGVFSMDGDVAPLAEIVELARRHDVRVVVDEAHGTGALGPGRARRGRRGRARRRGRRDRRHARQGARLLRRLRRLRPRDGALPRQHARAR